jgi:low temperature requirement protein LtrA
MATREWWQKPYLRRDEEFERHRAVTWLELFFDLVFVVVISRLAHNLASDMTVAGVLTFAFMFIPVWWAWNAATYYIERFESEGVEHRLITLLNIIPIAGMAIFSAHGLLENYVGFALSFWLARVINMVQWARAGLHVPLFRPVSHRFLLSFFGLVSPLIALSLLMEPPGRLVVWGIALVVDIVTPFFTLKRQAVLPPLSTSKLPERFGLMTIIVLGESLVGVINGLSDLGHLSLMSVIPGILGIFVTIGMWWVYFDFIARRAAKPSIYTAALWVYLHLPLLICITMTGVGIFAAIKDINQAYLTASSRIILATGAGFSLIFMGWLETTLRRRKGEPTHPVLSPFLKLIAGGAICLTGWFVENLGTVLLLVIILLGMSIQQVYGVMVWFGQEIESIIQEH